MSEKFRPQSEVTVVRDLTPKQRLGIAIAGGSSAMLGPLMLTIQPLAEGNFKGAAIFAAIDVAGIFTTGYGALKIVGKLENNYNKKLLAARKINNP